MKTELEAKILRTLECWTDANSSDYGECTKAITSLFKPYIKLVDYLTKTFDIDIANDPEIGNKIAELKKQLK